MTDHATLKVESGGAVGIVTLHQPQAGNSIDLAMARELLAAAIDFDPGESIRAVLLRSEDVVTAIHGRRWAGAWKSLLARIIVSRHLRLGWAFRK